ncbi:MAG: hypothetical protein V4713_09700 [Pseudomonadota bacterium]
MVAITATNSATPSLQSVLGRNQLAQARREADQAEARAQTLRLQADQAEQEAQASQGNVRNLTARNQQASTTYEAQLKPSKSELPSKTQDFLVGLYNATNENRVASGNVLKSSASATQVINTQGQTTGRIVDLRA